MMDLQVHGTMTEEQRRLQTEQLTNFARQKYKELKHLLTEHQSETQFVQTYLIAHRDVMVIMARATADVSKRRIYTH